MKKIMLFLILVPFVSGLSAQKYITKNGYIGIYSHTPLEDIKADNNQVASVLDISTGDLVFQVLIKSFHFEKALMEEHFNENYIESEKFPKASFKGRITNLSSVNFSANGTYNVTVEGDLIIRDITNKINTKGTVIVTPEGINANAKFDIVPEDYKIKIPGVVRDKINKSILVTVIMKYAPMEQKQKN